ncbi:hypothetical protein AB6A40_003323 [Gnathostoma spinigerum]|uniref:Glucosidase II beta subunit N-terminal domain-containing protein n=1 Tax=Gnathostoma spinigerum TaxID=75299 RepID=A0ABD6EES5_9BILA
MYYLWYVLFYGIFTGLQAIKLGLTRRDPLKPPKPSGYGDRPRGVPYTRGPLYATGATFTCFDGSKTILFAKVNNNYCDCPDGSDEPGTSACPDATFYCLNRGHKALIIPSSRVNDQICDCCDGSDEWNSAVDCPNICEQVGAEFREERLRQTEAAKKGYSKRAELVTEGMRILEEEKKNMETLQKQKEALNAERDVAEAKKKEAEEKEREATTKHREAWEGPLIVSCCNFILFHFKL